MWEVRGGERDDRGWALMCTVEVVGLRDGRSVVRTYQTGHPEWGHDTTGRVTGVSAAVGAELCPAHAQFCAPADSLGLE